MRILITGGTGFIGSNLVPFLLERGLGITVLTRGSYMGPEGVEYIQYDPTIPGEWQGVLSQHDVVINLAGATIFRRWTSTYKDLIRSSRILTTRNVVEAISSLESAGPKVLLSASAIGYYGFHGDDELSESSPPGDDFLAKVALEWEEEALVAQKRGIRVVLGRIGLVLGRNGGALKQMTHLFRWFVGGPVGSGRQWISWIHMEDLMAAILFLIENENLTGPFNLTSPCPVRNEEFACVLGRVLRRPSFLRAPAPLLRLLMGELGSLIIRGQKVLPTRLLQAGFRFRFPQLEGALRDLIRSPS